MFGGALPASCCGVLGNDIMSDRFASRERQLTMLFSLRAAAVICWPFSPEFRVFLLMHRNRAHLRPLRGSELIPEIPCEKQFMLVTGTAAHFHACVPAVLP